MDTTTTGAGISPEQAARLWYEVTKDAYSDEPDDGWDSVDYISGHSINYLNTAAREDGALEARFIAAYESSKHIAYADMPAYDDSSMWNPENAMMDLLIADNFIGVDVEAFDEAHDWVLDWKYYTKAQLWIDAIQGAYDDMPTNDEAECENCGWTYGAHDGTACPTDNNDEGDGFVGCRSVDYLSGYARENVAFVAKLIRCHEAMKYIHYADLPDYDMSDQWNPWNVMNDLLIADNFADSVDAEAFEKAYEWVEGWKDWTHAN